MIINTNSNLFKIPDHLHVIPTVEDALLLGLDIIWQQEIQIEDFNENLNIIKTQIRLKTKPNYSLYIIPLKVGILPQLIQTDWWVKPIDLYCQKDCVLKKNEPIAKAIIILRENYTIKQMSPDIINELVKKEEFINLQNYATREDNTYQILKYKSERNKLPEELQQIIKPNPRLRII